VSNSPLAEPVTFAALKDDLAFAQLQQPEIALNTVDLPAPFGSDHRGDAACRHRKAGAVEEWSSCIAADQALHIEDGFAHWCPLPPVQWPRYASMTALLARISGRRADRQHLAFRHHPTREHSDITNSILCSITTKVARFSRLISASRA